MNAASKELADRLLAARSLGIVHAGVRRARGTFLAVCDQPLYFHKDLQWFGWARHPIPTMEEMAHA
jgi:hypothetical protein